MKKRYFKNSKLEIVKKYSSRYNKDCRAKQMQRKDKKQNVSLSGYILIAGVKEEHI